MVYYPGQKGMIFVRSQQEMLSLILNQAENTPQVRLVFLNGSRAAEKPNDQWQDYDIAWGVTDLSPFLAENHWLEPFGKRLLMQTPEDMELFPPSLGGWHTWLMQFEDGNRVDLLLFPLTDLERYLSQDSQVRLLLDKDKRIQSLPSPSDRAFWVKRPTAGEYRDCCNEFWWVAPYVAKGLCRHQPLYVLHHLEGLRKELLRMLSWKAGYEKDFQLSVGKCCGELEKLLPADVWRRLLSCWCGSEEGEQWKALWNLSELFLSAAEQTAALGGFEMNHQEAEGSMKLLRRMRQEYHEKKEEYSHVGL